MASLIAIRDNVHSAAGRKDLLEGDTKHYLEIARDFAHGNFSMDYVRARPHRQPLYPFLLSPAFRWFGGDLALLAAVNVLLATVTFLLIYFALLRLFHSRLTASLVGLLFLVNPFVRAHATRHLLTEPLHLFQATGVIFAVIDYMKHRSPRSLALAAGLAGLDYLTRPNGLFVFASMISALALHEAWRIWRHPANRRAEGMAALKSCALAVVVFAIASAPSWIPRCAYYGDPIHHGYLSNYLWTDTYEEGHVGQRYAIHGPGEYFSKHDAGDIAKRWLHGIGNCGFTIPVRVEKKIPLLYFLALAGLGVALWERSAVYLAVAVFGVLQMLPLVWTNLSNPTMRVPYAAELPFEIVFAAIFVSRLPDIFRGVCARFDKCRQKHRLINCNFLPFDRP